MKGHQKSLNADGLSKISQIIRTVCRTQFIKDEPIDKVDSLSRLNPQSLDPHQSNNRSSMLSMTGLVHSIRTLAWLHLLDLKSHPPTEGLKQSPTSPNWGMSDPFL